MELRFELEAMNGRQRSGAAAVHHQRQLSDNPLDMSSSNGRWLQSTGLQHFQSSANVISESDPFSSPPPYLSIDSKIKISMKFLRRSVSSGEKILRSEVLGKFVFEFIMHFLDETCEPKFSL